MPRIYGIMRSMIKKALAVFAAFAALCLAAEPISVGAVNCGAFRYGKPGVAEGEYAAEWARLAADNPADVFFYEDVGTKAFPKGSLGVAGLDIRVALKDGRGDVSVVNLPREIDVNGKTRRTPRYRALRVVRELDGKKIAFYGLHLVAESHIKGPRPQKGELLFSQKLRREQFKALVADARQFDYAVFAGDFNAQRPSEYDVFTEAGYSIGNCSKAFGVSATLRTIPADSVVVSPGLGIVKFEMALSYELNTDHRPVFAKIDTREGIEAAFAAVPSVAEYLNLPRGERVKWFADGVFRRKMFDHGCTLGDGLMSRWVAVDKIPNLRDVGGMKTLDGCLLRRGLLYRSAGWNDNAYTPAHLSESEWTKGRIRLTDNGRIALAKLGIKTDLDLRAPAECWGMTGSPLGDDVRWVNVSFGWYGRFKTLPWTWEAVRKAFDVLADESNYPVVFHCIGGADRTGCLAMMIEVLCGVDEDEAVKDWELTGCNTARFTFTHERGIDQFLSCLSEFPGDTAEQRMRAFLAHCGVSAAQMDSVRRILRGRE